MSFTVRDLYAVAGMSRPDVPQVQYGVALQQAVKRVCRETLMARVTQTYTITADTNSVTITKAESEILMVHQAWWMGASQTDWTPLAPVSFDVANQNQMWGTDSAPYAFSQQDETVLVYGTPTEDGQLKVTISFAPTVDVDTAPLPAKARPAVEVAAERLLLRIPGAGQSFQASEARERELRGMLQNLKAISLFGESGEIVASVPVNPYGTE